MNGGGSNTDGSKLYMQVILGTLWKALKCISYKADHDFLSADIGVKVFENTFYDQSKVKINCNTEDVIAIYTHLCRSLVIFLCIQL